MTKINLIGSQATASAQAMLCARGIEGTALSSDEFRLLFGVVPSMCRREMADFRTAQG